MIEVPGGDVVIIRTRSAEETESVGERLAAFVRAGDVLALMGELGSGKTTFVRGLHRGLGCADRVRSPSFTTLFEYDGDPPLFHFDLYRYPVAGPGFLEEFEDWLGERGVVVLEWADRLGEWIPEPRLEIRFSDERDLRAIEVTPVGVGWADRMARWRGSEAP